MKAVTCEELNDLFKKGIVLYDATPKEPEFYNAGCSCQGCGAPLLTNGTYHKCEYCGGGIVPKGKRFKPGGQRVGFNSMAGIQLQSPSRTVFIKKA